MSRPPVDTASWRGFADEPDPRLIWPAAGLFTPGERAALIGLRARVQAGRVSEDTDLERRLLFYRKAVQDWRLFSG